MSDELVCPDCGHSVAFHGYYGVCEAPVEPTTAKIYQRCGCNKTTYAMINALQAKLEKAKAIIRDCYGDAFELARRAIDEIEKLEA